jgi:HAAS domain-containing protein
MSTTTGLPPNVADYLQELRAELMDLAAEERDDLLSEVEPSLFEAAGETDEPLAARLGPPADFAADLRASAGLPPAPRPAEPRSGGLTAALRELASHPAVARTAAVLHELAPVWWVIRAYVVVEALAMATDNGAASVAAIARSPELPRLGGPELGAVVLALALVASIAAGIAARRRPERGRGARIAVNLALAVLAIPVAAQLVDAQKISPVTVTYEPAETSPATGLVYDGALVDNVYAYDRNGRLLHDVRLYDSSGKPLDFGRDFANANRRRVFDRSGEQIFNAFPVRYFEPGTRRVANPNAGPRISPPKLKTPPLRERRR